jgi:hypothetical protein
MPGRGAGCVGFLRYEAASAFDKALLTHAPDGPLAWFAVLTRHDPGPKLWHQSCRRIRRQHLLGSAA